MESIITICVLCLTATFGLAFDAACMTKCQQPLVDLQPANGGANLSSAEAAIQQKKACEVYRGLKACILACDGGTQAWETMKSVTEPVLQTCGLGDGTADGSSGENEDMVCIEECKQTTRNDVSIIYSTITDSAESDAKLCEVQKIMKTCMFSCQGGAKNWELTIGGFNDGCEESTSTLSPMCPANCEKQASVKLSAYQPQDGDDVSAAQMAEWTKKSCEGYREMKTCILACDDGKQEWKNILISFQNPGDGQSVLDMCGLGNGTGDGSSGEKDDMVCIDECKQTTRNDVSIIYSTITDSAESDAKLCEVQKTMKTCMFSCQGGAKNWELTIGGFNDGCEESTSTLTPVNPSPVGNNATTSETSTQVAEYCRRVLNQKNGDTSFCKYQNFKETCKNVCPQ